MVDLPMGRKCACMARTGRELVPFGRPTTAGRLRVLRGLTGRFGQARHRHSRIAGTWLGWFLWWPAC
jgi:hypothetical protein